MLEKLISVLLFFARKLAQKLGLGGDGEDIAEQVTMELAATMRRAHAEGDDTIFDAVRMAADPTPWLWRPMNRRAIDRRRKRDAVTRQDAVFHDSYHERPDPFLDPHAFTEQQEIRRIVNDVLSRMSPEHSGVVALRVVRGLEWKEVAKTLGISVQTAHRRLKEVVKRLEKPLADHRDGRTKAASKSEPATESTGQSMVQSSVESSVNAGLQEGVAP